MARIRTIKPEFWKSEDLSALREAVHILAAALLNQADDEGYFNANVGLLKAEVFPLREPSVSVQDGLIDLVSIRYLRLGTAPDGKRYGHILKFIEHQRVNRPTASKIKDLGIVWDHSVSDHGELTVNSLPERKGKEGKGREKSTLVQRAARGGVRFQEFWTVYPRKHGKVQAERYWSRHGLDEIADRIIAHVRANIASNPNWRKDDGQYIPMGSTYLNQKRWEDDVSFRGVGAAAATYAGECS